MREIIESRMKFIVKDELQIIKFDETTFFDKHFKKLQGSKGIDFLAYNVANEEYLLIEVKNFRGVEHEPATKKRLKLGTEESVILETALKVRDSIACIVGAVKSEQEVEITGFSKCLHKNSTLKVILLLEAASVNEVHYQLMTNDLKKKLSWLNVKVFVLNKDRLRAMIPSVDISNLPSHS